MEQKIFKMIFFGFIIAFFIDLALADIFYTEENKVDVTVAPHMDMQAFSLLDISGETLKALQSYCLNEKLDFCTYLSGMMMHYHFNVPELEGRAFKKNILNKSEQSFTLLYHKIFDDLICFPVAVANPEDINRYEYSNSFLAERTYGGNRKHMGIDIMDINNESGYFNIVSMTDGEIVNMGWLELGGYRIGIRSDSGTYFYYAHLQDYAQDLQEGQRVTAGQLLGHMGSTGYGPEGTDDQFAVHLHMGIALTIDDQEFWVNPYAILRMLDLKLK